MFTLILGYYLSILFNYPKLLDYALLVSLSFVLTIKRLGTRSKPFYKQSFTNFAIKDIRVIYLGTQVLYIYIYNLYHILLYTSFRVDPSSLPSITPSIYFNRKIVNLNIYINTIILIIIIIILTNLAKLSH